MTDELNERLAGLQRAMAAPLPSPTEIAAGKGLDRAMAERIHTGLPGVPLHHAYAVLESLRVIQRIDAAKAQAVPAFPLPVRPDGTHFYVSTYCLHSDHAACRLTCLCCGQPCQCSGCEHATADSLEP